MIRELVFDPMAWLVWDGTALVVYTVYCVTHRSTNDEELTPIPLVVEDNTPEPEVPITDDLMVANVNDDGAHVIRTSKLKKPDWMS